MSSSSVSVVGFRTSRNFWEVLETIPLLGATPLLYLVLALAARCNHVRACTHTHLKLLHARKMGQCFVTSKSLSKCRQTMVWTAEELKKALSFFEEKIQERCWIRGQFALSLARECPNPGRSIPGSHGHSLLGFLVFIRRSDASCMEGLERFSVVWEKGCMCVSTVLVSGREHGAIHYWG